jgi:hypothetical protein
MADRRIVRSDLGLYARTLRSLPPITPAMAEAMAAEWARRVREVTNG